MPAVDHRGRGVEHELPWVETAPVAQASLARESTFHTPSPPFAGIDSACGFVPGASTADVPSLWRAYSTCSRESVNTASDAETRRHVRLADGR